MNLASEAPYDNRPVIGNIVKARSKKARLLGFNDFASYMTDNVMAKTPEAAPQPSSPDLEPDQRQSGRRSLGNASLH